MSIHVVPAYGRDYRSKDAVSRDWYGGLDFRIADISSQDDGRYVSTREIPNGETVYIRYANLRKVVRLVNRRAV